MTGARIPPEYEVPIGAATVACAPGATLVCIGLGSCVGVALFDEPSGIGGLAHIMLPRSPAEGTAHPGRYADLAVPALAGAMAAAGARHDRLVAVIAGGATLFAGGDRPSLGERNTTAVVEALAASGVPLAAQASGGTRGRALRITLGAPMQAVVRIAGGSDERIHGACGPAGAAAA